jgi:hypothetical protein
MSYRPNADARPDAPYVANANAPTTEVPPYR